MPEGRQRMEEIFAERTICIRCVHHRHDTDGPVWYDHRCGHPDALQSRPDFTLGTVEYEMAFCRDVNPTGSCDLYEEAPCPKN